MGICMVLLAHIYSEKTVLEELASMERQRIKSVLPGAFLAWALNVDLWHGPRGFALLFKYLFLFVYGSHNRLDVSQ